MKVQLNLAKTGYNSFLSKHQTEILKYLWANPTKSKPVTEIHTEVNKALTKQGNRKISRLTIHNTLDLFSRENIVWFLEEIAQGGVRRLYYAEMDESQFKQHIVKNIIDRLLTEYPNEAKKSIRSFNIVY